MKKKIILEVDSYDLSILNVALRDHMNRDNCVRNLAIRDLLKQLEAYE